MTLDEIRTEIDKIDSAIKPLFVRRMECAKHVAWTKSATGGEVFVPEREQSVIEQRSSDIDAEIREEYVAFLRYLMSVCRKYEYGLLNEMQDKIMTEALEEAKIPADKAHSKVEIAFCCNYEASNLNLFLNMAKLNKIGILNMQMKVQDERQHITMVLDGNVNDGDMRCLLCQIGKEAEDFRILNLY